MTVTLTVIRAYLLLFGSVLAACAGASNDPGLEAWLRVDSAQYVEGRMPEPNGGPEILSARVPHNTLEIGSIHEHVSGSVEASATAVAIGRDRDKGYWIVTTDVPTVDEPNVPSFRGLLELARDFPAGPFQLQLSAVNRAGKFGPRTTLDLEASATPTDATLVVALSWDNTADLDLHVIDPAGIPVWARNINSYEPPPPGASADAGAWQSGGILDVDSNANCSADGRDREHVAWRQPPPSGRYTVRVATAALCGHAAAHWSVTVTLDGTQLASAAGVSVSTDTRAGSGAQSGVRALTFVVP
jgi:hypothetical protein